MYSPLHFTIFLFFLLFFPPLISLMKILCFSKILGNSSVKVLSRENELIADNKSKEKKQYQKYAYKIWLLKRLEDRDQRWKFVWETSLRAVSKIRTFREACFRGDELDTPEFCVRQASSRYVGKVGWRRGKKLVGLARRKPPGGNNWTNADGEETCNYENHFSRHWRQV